MFTGASLRESVRSILRVCPVASDRLLAGQETAGEEGVDTGMFTGCHEEHSSSSGARAPESL